MKPKSKLKRALIITGIAVFTTSVLGSFVAAYFVYAANFGRSNIDETRFTTAYRYSDVNTADYPRDTLHFMSGNNRLTAYLFGRDNTRGLVVIAHGIGGYSGSNFMFTRYFVDSGYRVFAYDCTGSGVSEGKSEGGLYQSATDLDNALTFVDSSPDLRELPIYLLGHSWGGYAVCAVLAKPHKINAVVSFAGYNDPQAMFAAQGIEIVGNLYYTLAAQLWIVSRVCFGQGGWPTAVEALNGTHIPVMVVQGKDDNLVTADTLSIYAHRAEISNPNVQYVLQTMPYNCHHSDLFYSPSRGEYAKKAMASLNAAMDTCKNLSADDRNACRKKWASEFGFSKEKYHELDSALMKGIVEFYNRFDK